MSNDTFVDSLVSVGPKQPGAGWCVYLKGVGEDTICVGPYANPALAKELAEKVKKYLAALIEQVRTAA